MPRGRTTLVIGSPGSGKTVFALQTLVNGARRWQEPGIFVAFEENSEQIVANAASFGWDLEALSKKELFFLDARMSADTVRTGPFDLTGMLASLAAKAQQMGARRIVFDSIDVLLTLMNDPLGERQEIYRLHEWLSSTGLTGIITTRGDPGVTADDQRFGFIQYTTDCTVQLLTRLAERVAVRELRIVKYRGSGFQGNEFPFVIAAKGIEVAAFDTDPSKVQVFTDRVSSGVERLDTMLNGGYLRGSSVLITGAPGTAKSSLSGAFAAAACRRGERTLMVSYDEAGAGNRAQPGIHQHQAPALHRRWPALPVLRSDRDGQRRGAPDPVAKPDPRARAALPRRRSAFRTDQGGRAAERPQCCFPSPLPDEGKRHHVRLYQLVGGPGSFAVESSPLRVSTIADTWIHLSYLVQGGERNRALTIIKSRGTRHSNQVRELILSDDGITLADVYSSGGAVLMGTLRWEREIAERSEELRRQAELERRRRELELAVTEANARIAILQREAEARAAELSLLDRHELTRSDAGSADLNELLRRRRADEARS